MSFCLSQLPLNDRMVRKLADGVRLYKRTLGDDDVFDSFAAMLAKAKKLAGGSGGGASANCCERMACTTIFSRVMVR